MKTVIIMRGLPGSGKSTFAKLIADEVFEADQFFYKNGKYKYIISKIKEAHDDCFERFKQSIKCGCGRIAVANTFTREWEFKRYKKFAEINNYKVFIIVMENRHNSQNVHEVSNETVEIMKNRFEVNL